MDAFTIAAEICAGVHVGCCPARIAALEIQAVKPNNLEEYTQERAGHAREAEGVQSAPHHQKKRIVAHDPLSGE